MTAAGTRPVVAPAGQTRLADAVESANTLLYHAVGSGRDLSDSVREPIIKARAVIERGGAPSEDEERKFLDAYAKLALRSAPVTAATLDATSRRHEPGRLGRLLGLRPVSDAQRLGWFFGLFALALIACIAAGEWAHSFMVSLSAAEKRLSANSEELRVATFRRESIDDQVGKLLPLPGSTPDTANSAAMRQVLAAQKDEITIRIWKLQQSVLALGDEVEQGHRTLGRMFGRDRFQYNGPLLVVFGSFLLPLLYGALGTCAFVMRSLFREMVDRTFDGRRSCEYTVRIFLGMLSGITMQWVVARPDTAAASGVAPAVLAFLGGYSVEMLFTAMDRLVNLVAGRVRPAHRGQPVPPRPRPDPPAPRETGLRRIRVREAPANDNATGPRVARPAPMLATARAR